MTGADWALADEALTAKANVERARVNALSIDRLHALRRFCLASDRLPFVRRRQNAAAVRGATARQHGNVALSVALISVSIGEVRVSGHQVAVNYV